jgi:hypothetical protein
LGRQIGRYGKFNEEEQSEVKTFNLFDLSWDEIQKKGLDKHIDKERYVKHQNEYNK